MSSFVIEKGGGDDVRSRTKRKRTSLVKSSRAPVVQAPTPVVVMSTSSPPSSSVEFSGIATEEEELELANSLILLSRGGNLKDRAAAALMKSADHTLAFPNSPFIRIEDVRKITMDTDDKVIVIPTCQLVEAAAQSVDKDFMCEICSKSFGSFQALGGHKASHKKLKLEGDEYMVQSSTDTGGTTDGAILKDVASKTKDEIKVNPPAAKTRAVSSVGSKERAHVCQVCNAEFTSGQALGGHMRRHKPINQGGNASRNKKEKNGIELDLNFPPLEQQVDTRVVQQRPLAFPFEGNPPTQLSLGNPALTNCLYG